MSLNVRKLVKKISGLFKEEEPERVYTRYVDPTPCPWISHRWEQRSLIRDQPPTVKIRSRYEQLEVVRFLIERIDETGEDEKPIKWNYKRHEES